MADYVNWKFRTRILPRRWHESRGQLRNRDINNRQVVFFIEPIQNGSPNRCWARIEPEFHFVNRIVTIAYFPEGVKSGDEIPVLLIAPDIKTSNGFTRPAERPHAQLNHGHPLVRQACHR